MISRLRFKIIIISLLLFFIFTSCTTVVQKQEISFKPAPRIEKQNDELLSLKQDKIEEEELEEIFVEEPVRHDLIQEKLVEAAEKYLGADKFVVKGKKFLMDCSGTISALYYYAGIDLTRDFYKHTGDGVKRIFKTLKQYDLLYETENPAPGDIIFWDNTYDRNNDNKFNDRNTHAGMVVRVSEDGTIDYIHFDYLSGIVIAKMNFKYPDEMGKIIDGKWVMINTPIRIPIEGQEYHEKQLSSQLCRIFGMGYFLEFEE